MTKFEPPIPILRSFDEKATKDFYIDFLGFETVFEHRFEPAAPLYFGVRKGDCVLHISEHYGDCAPGAAVRITVEDVRTYCKTLNDKGYKYARPDVKSQSWGEDEMRISDPSGNSLIFCTST